MTSRLPAILIAILVPLPTFAADAAKSTAAVAKLKEAVDAGPAALADLVDKEFAKTPLTKADAKTARDLLWKAHEAIVRKERADEIKERRLRDGKLEMPLEMKTFGKKPDGGRSLWLSLHGGGGAPKAVNDS